MHVSCCPGCGSIDFISVGRNGKAFGITIGNEVFHQPEYHVQHCLQCGLYYKSHVLEETELNAYYQKVNFLKWERNGLYPTESLVVRSLSELPKGSRILDFGCSTGRLCSYLVDRYDCYGIEINQDAAAIAQKRGVKIVTEHEIEEELFDAIVLSDVFEHLAKPTDVLSKLCQHLRTRGMLILSTGNADAKACQKDIANFWYFRNVEHLCMFSQKYARFLSEKLALELTRWKTISHYDPGVHERFLQHARDFVYWQFHGDRKSILKPVLTLVPHVKRAEYWDNPPYFACSKDQVIAVFQGISLRKVCR